MQRKSLRRIMNIWGMSQERFGEITYTNRGVIQSYLRKVKESKPSVEFMIRLYELCGKKVSVANIWENNFDDEDIPPQPILDGSILEKGKDTADMKLEEAFKIIMKEMIKLKQEVKGIVGEEE